MDAFVIVLVGYVHLCLFVVGTAVGSFLNVAAYRLPRGRSLLWPSSRCGSCLKAIRGSDNVPLLGYLRLGGRCRACGVPYSARYFWFEFAMGVAFVLLWDVEVMLNVHRYAAWANPTPWAMLQWGMVPPGAVGLFLGHVVMLSFLVCAGVILAQGERLPAGLLAWGVAAGVTFAVTFPWPYPHPAGRTGFVPFPVVPPGWIGLPNQCPLLGLLTGLAGVMVPGLAMRWLKPAEEARGVLMLAGGFLGWQLTCAAAAVPLVAVVCGSRGTRLGLWALAGVVVVWLGWAWALASVF